MPDRLTTLVLAATVLLLFAGTAVLAEEQEPDPAEWFIDAMLRGIDAERVECPVEVREAVQGHRMRAACALFKGSFERFELRWNLEVTRSGAYGEQVHSWSGPAIEPQTDWEATGDSYDRIYRIGPTALGVRFAKGELLMVW